MMSAQEVSKYCIHNLLRCGCSLPSSFPCSFPSYFPHPSLLTSLPDLTLSFRNRDMAPSYLWGRGEEIKMPSIGGSHWEAL
eukprot:1146287-Pelagomonas_calceolata.AAC.1